MKTSYKVFGGYSVGGTPVLIPNTEVKSYSADDTAWETMWESRSPPKLFHNPVFTKDGVFYRFGNGFVEGRKSFAWSADVLPVSALTSWLALFRLDSVRFDLSVQV